MSQFRNLVFEGGGVKGIAYAGAIRVLEKKRVLADIRRVGGSSAGAIMAALLAVGASARDIEEIVGHTSFRKFMDDSFGLIRDVARLLDEYGWYKGDAFADWMKKQIHVLTNRPDLDFKGLHELAASNPKRYRELYVIGTNLSTQLEVVYSAELTPDVPIWEAVRISMSIPLFFAAVRKNSSIYIDGGVTWNYPIDLFDEKRYVFDPAAAGAVAYTQYRDDHIYNKETLGFRVDTVDEIQAEKDSWRSLPKRIDRFVDYTAALVTFMLDTANRTHLHENDWHRTVFIDALGVSTTDFNLSDDRVAALVRSGVIGAEKYFQWFGDAQQKPLNRVS